MKSIRHGKIGRLPEASREQVNERLDAGEPGKRLVACLPASRRDPSRTGRCRRSRLRQDHGAAGRRKAKLAGQRCEPHWQALPVVGAWMDEDLAKLKPIKVNQGDIFYPGRIRSAFGKATTRRGRPALRPKWLMRIPNAD